MGIVNEFVNILKLKGIDAYMAVSDIQPGTQLWDKIESNIRSSNCVLAILTQDGSRSEMVNQEIATANAFKITVVPIVERGVKLKGVLAGREYVEFDKDNPNQAYINANNYLERLKLQIENQKFVRNLVLFGLGLWLLSEYSK